MIQAARVHNLFQKVTDRSVNWIALSIVALKSIGLSEILGALNPFHELACSTVKFSAGLLFAFAASSVARRSPLRSAV